MIETIIKTLINAFGLDEKITPEELMGIVERAKTLLPEIAAKVQEIDARSKRIETMLMVLCSNSQSESAISTLKELYKDAPELVAQNS